LVKLLTKVAFSVAMAALLVYFLISRGPDLRANVSKRDSIAYWAAARLLLQHQNPYDTATVLQLERERGYAESKPLVLRTPPWSLFMVLPLGVLSAFWAWAAWVGLSLATLVVSLRLCWRLVGGGIRPPGLFWLVGYLFAPVPACLVAGQIGLVLLLGIALFLWLEPERPFLAGVALILPFAKPHLLALVWVILAFWATNRKHRPVAGGFITALVVATAIALVFDPLVFQHYRGMLHQAAIGKEFIPALSGVLRLLFFHRFFLVQFIPLAVALIWCVWFYRRHHSQWQWHSHGLALMLVSVLTTPYAWLTDEVVLLPAVLQVALWAYNARERFTWKTKTVLILFACLNALLLLILRSKIPFSTGIYFWSSLVWFGWYVYGRRFRVDATAGANASLDAMASRPIGDRPSSLL
jgi:Glycosyltransferase family 87